VIQLPTIYPYQTTLTNDYLGKAQVVRGRSPQEVEMRAWEVLRRWAEQEQRKREQEGRKQEQEARRQQTLKLAQDKEAMRLEADRLTGEAQAELEEWRTILATGLARPVSFDWAALLDRSPLPQFDYDRKYPKPPAPTLRTPRVFVPPREEPLPSLAEVQARGGLREHASLVERLLPGPRARRERRAKELATAWALEREDHKRRHEDAVAAARKAHEDEVLETRRLNETTLESHRRRVVGWEAARTAAWEQHCQSVEEIRQRRGEHEAEVANARELVAAGDHDAIAQYVTTALAQLEAGDAHDLDSEAGWDSGGTTLVVSSWLPGPADLPATASWRYVATRSAVEPQALKPKEAAALYESAIQQVALLCVHRVFGLSGSPHVDSVVFNGWVRGIDSKTGNPFTSCI